MPSVEEIKKSLSQCFASSPIEKAWLFGSYARGEARYDSDIDILVTFSRNETIGLKFISIINKMESLLNRKVDLVEDQSLLPWVRPFVENEKILLYERKD